jgi:16S rRNA (cytosine1402-N4)-methyltransferase
MAGPDVTAATRHIPVLRDRVIALLAPALQEPGSVLVDATVGLGGHAEAALAACPHMHLVGLDRDPAALRLSGERLAPFGERVTLVHAVYDELPQVLEELGLTSIQGILFDLGVSSMQLDESDRGFAYSQDAPLDMRMDPTAGITAAEVLNTYPAADLARILRQYGEEKFASRIAARVVVERKIAPFTTSARLVDLVRDAIPAPARRTGGNPAKRTFQALRIEVNGELDVLRRAIPAALAALAPTGRIVVMSYQSLEDRIVKQALAVGAHPDVPPGLPFIPADRRPWLRLLTRGAEQADAAEIESNPRAASVRVRAAERVEVAA